MPTPTAFCIVEDIVADLTGRRGLRQAWEDIDDDVQEEIKKKWITIVDEAMHVEED